MQKKLFIGIDNGVSGSIGVTGAVEDFVKTPTVKWLKYTKKKAFITRIDHKHLTGWLEAIIFDAECVKEEVSVIVERPMVNPKRFNASTSALRAYEATLIVLENLRLSFEVVDSKAWQKAMLPSGVKGSSELKEVSKLVGEKLFPQFKDVKHPDRDGILMAEYLKRNQNLNSV